MQVYLNGQFVNDTDAKLSAFDAGIQHGVGLFETMRATNGKVYRLTEHVNRLVDSASQLGLADHLQPQPLCDAIELTLEKNQIDEARVRLAITGGDLSLLAAAKNASQRKPKHQPSILITATQPTIYPQQFFTDGVTVIIADPKANPFDPGAGHKTLNYWMRLRTLADAATKQAGEALWFSITNHLVGGAVSNALLVKDSELFTPIARGEEENGALPAAVLPGITRAAVIELADRADLSVHRKMLCVDDVLDADEVMLTNSSWGILPVVNVEAKTISDGKVGPITKQLRQSLLEDMNVTT